MFLLINDLKQSQVNTNNCCPHLLSKTWPVVSIKYLESEFASITPIDRMKNKFVKLISNHFWSFTILTFDPFQWQIIFPSFNRYVVILPIIHWLKKIKIEFFSFIFIRFMTSLWLISSHKLDGGIDPLVISNSWVQFKNFLDAVKYSFF